MIRSARRSKDRLQRALAIAAMTSLASLHTQPAAADTLVGVVEESLATNPELGAIRFNRKAIDHELTAARGLGLPTVDLRADDGRIKNWNRTDTGIVTGRDSYRSHEVQGVVSQRIFDGFEVRNEVERQKNRVESARWRVMDTANSVALRAVQSYLELQRAGAVLKAARANLDAHRALLSRVSGRYEGGRASSSDYTEAQSRTAQAEALLVEAGGRQQDAEALFRAVVGRAPGKLAAVGVPPFGGTPSVEQAVARAVDFSPSVMATEHDAASANAAVGSATARLMPHLNVELSTDHGWSTVEDGDRSIDARAMLVVRWNLFNGGIDKARIWEAKSRALEAQEVSLNTRRIIERETRASWIAMEAAARRVPLLRRQVDATRATRKAYDSQFDAGTRRLLDLLNVQSELFVAEATLRTEEFSRVYNSHRVLAAMGELVPALGLEAPPEAINSFAPTVVHGWRDGWQGPRQQVDDTGPGWGATTVK